MKKKEYHKIENWIFIFGKNITVFENHIKSLIQHCERSELSLQFE